MPFNIKDMGHREFSKVTFLKYFELKLHIYIHTSCLVLRSIFILVLSIDKKKN